MVVRACQSSTPGSLGRTLDMVSWQRLIRFSPPDEEIVYFGEPIGTLSELEDIGAQVALGRLRAAVIEVDETGPLSNTARVTQRIVTVGRLLAPLTLHDCHDIKCIGLNYRKHSGSFA